MEKTELTMNAKPKNILFMIHLPPPVHDSTIIGEYLKDNRFIGVPFRGHFINMLMSRTVSETGKINIVKMLRFSSVWFRLLLNLIYRKPDLCYYTLTPTGTAFYKDCLMVGLLRLFRIKIIYHLHNKGIRQNQRKKLNDRLYRFIFKNSSVILLSEQLYLDIEKYVVPWRVYYCPNGIRDNGMPTELLSLPEAKTFRILFLSNLFVTKGVFDLIDACALLKKRGYEFKCDFIGGEGDVNEKQFNAYVKQKELTENVRYLGKRFGKLKEIAYDQADVFVLPTSYECFPLVILEAMQHSLPVVSTFEGGIPDMVKDGINGFLIDQHDVPTLADRLELLLQYPAMRKQMGKEGRQKYEKYFTLNVFEHKLLTILQDAIK